MSLQNRICKYAILNEECTKINSVLVNDPYPEGYWPGYGKYITCEFGQSDPVPPQNLEIRSGSRSFTYLTIRPNMPFNIGDKMDINDGTVTIVPEPEPINLANEQNDEEII
jgi:hypothetical protein